MSHRQLNPEPTFDSVRARLVEISEQLRAGKTLRRDWLHGIVRADSTDSRRPLSLVQRANMPILAGTDVVGTPARSIHAGFAAHAELAGFVALGLTPLRALQAATLNPAKLLRATDSLGTVAPGKLADLVLLDADPLADITNTTAIAGVVANGRYFDRAAIDLLLAEAQAMAKSR